MDNGDVPSVRHIHTTTRMAGSTRLRISRGGNRRHGMGHSGCTVLIR